MTITRFRIVQRVRLRENQIFFALTIILGVLCALASVLFSLAIEGTEGFSSGLPLLRCEC